jgi:hypothetical protein
MATAPDPDARFGSISTKLSYLHHVRFAPDSDRKADVQVRQLRAINGNERTHFDHLGDGGEERFFTVVPVLGGVGAFGGGYCLARIGAFTYRRRLWESWAHSRRPSGPTHRGSPFR